MVLKVEWTSQAKQRIQEISSYLKSKAGERVARRIIRKIHDRTRILVKNPKAGQREELSEGNAGKFRRLVEGNYKIVYQIEDNTVNIITVWDCRRDPGSLHESIDKTAD